MKIYISYFYQIRFFPENLIPVSTAAWDPKWYHDFKDPNYIFRDKRNVINGVRCNGLVCTKIYDANHDCPIDGVQNCRQPKDGSCTFMMKYYKFLTEEVPFDKLISNLQQVPVKLRPGSDVCLIVHESPSRGCAERPCLVRYFNDNGYRLIEWDKSMV